MADRSDAGSLTTVGLATHGVVVELIGVLPKECGARRELAMHPQTLFDAASLAALRAATAGTHAALATNLEKYLMANNAVLAPSVAPAIEAAHAAAFPTITRLMGDRPADVTTAAAILDHHFGRQWSGDRDLGQATDLATGAIGYDVFFDLLDPAKQASYRTKIAASAADLAVAATAGEWWTTDLVQNHNWVNFAALGLAGQALQGEDPQAQNWRDMAAANFANVKIVQDLVVDGSWHEGIGYLEFGLSNAIAYWLGAVRRGSNDDKTELLRRVGRYILYAQRGGCRADSSSDHCRWSLEGRAGRPRSGRRAWTGVGFPGTVTAPTRGKTPPPRPPDTTAPTYWARSGSPWGAP